MKIADELRDGKQEGGGMHMSSAPVNSVSICGFDELLKEVFNVPPQPLISLFQVKHLVHQQQHHPQRNIVIHLHIQTHSEHYIRTNV